MMRRPHVVALMAAQLEAGDRANNSPMIEAPKFYVERASMLLDEAEKRDEEKYGS